jgi:hypothetical protein
LITAGFYLLTVWYTGKIIKIWNPKYTSLAMVIMAFNPLVIIESLVSSHNDIVMMGIAMTGIYAYVRRRYWSSFIIISLSVALKLMTLFLIPIVILVWIFHTHDVSILKIKRIANKYLINSLFWRHMFQRMRKIKILNKISAQVMFSNSLLLTMLIGFVLVLFHREVLPWYWIWIIPFIALSPERLLTIILSTGVSLGLLLRYVPYLYYGNWDPPVGMYKDVLTYISIGLSCIIYIFVHIKNSQKKTEIS